MKFSSSLLIYWIILCLPLMNCGGNFLDRRDSNNIDADDFYQDEADAIASVNAAYAQLQSLYLWARGVHFLLDFTSGEIGQTPNTQGPSLELLSYTFGSHGNDLIEGPWTGFYQTIAKTNITLDAVPNIDMDGPLQRQVLAEARFLRALSYFYLNVLWNGGPLRTEENLEQLHLDRASSPDIWSFIEADLTTAIPDLPWEYDVANVGRATKGAALSLLGKAHLYQEAWADAEQNFSRVIQEGPYQLMGEGAATVKEAIAAMRSNHDFGVKNNAEAVFEVQFKGKAGGLYWQTDGRSQRESTIRPHEYGVNGKSFFNAKPSENLLSAFEGYDPTGGNTGIGERDPRFEAFFFTEHDTLDVGPYADILANSGYAWKKYQESSKVSSFDNDCNHDVIRYADVLLMQAEAKVKQGKVADGIALINRIRRRADPTGNILADIPVGSQEEAIQALISERQVELCGEQVRRMDLVRWGIAVEHLPGFQPGKNEYFPIPQSEVDNNEALNENNPGY